MKATLNLNLVQTFVSVAEAESFSRAAGVLGLPTSSVSRAVARLEAQLGAKLFQRNTRRTALTAMGRTYYQHAARALAELADGEHLIGELQGEARGEIRMTAPTDLDDGFLAAQLAAFAALHPRIRVTVALTNQMSDLIGEGLDLAMRVADRLPDSSFVARSVGRYRAWLIASPDYLRRRGHPRGPADLTRHDCVLPVPGPARWVMVGPRGEEGVEVTGRVAADDLQFVRHLVAAGAGIGVLPFAPGSAEVTDPRLSRVLPDYVIRGPRLYVVVPSAKTLPLRVTLLREFLLAAYGKAAPRSPRERP
jgi:DNA-binding transcriptional LysR family regulator